MGTRRKRKYNRTGVEKQYYLVHSIKSYSGDCGGGVFRTSQRDVEEVFEIDINLNPKECYEFIREELNPIQEHTPSLPNITTPITPPQDTVSARILSISKIN